jgi:hypothetical protein
MFWKKKLQKKKKKRNPALAPTNSPLSFLSYFLLVRRCRKVKKSIMMCEINKYYYLRKRVCKLLGHQPSNCAQFIIENIYLFINYLQGQSVVLPKCQAQIQVSIWTK